MYENVLHCASEGLWSLSFVSFMLSPPVAVWTFECLLCLSWNTVCVLFPFFYGDRNISALRSHRILITVLDVDLVVVYSELYFFHSLLDAIYT